MDKNLLAPCGLYCGVCSIYIADRDDNPKFKRALMGIYSSIAKSEDDIKCSGCMSDGDLFEYCKSCAIRDCIKEKGFEGCYQCDDFPCKHVKRFPIPVGKKVIMRAIPAWRQLGTEKWIEAEMERYHCPNCGNPLFRGAKRCNKCKIPVDVD